MPTQSSPEVKVDPRRYFESVEERRSDRAARLPVCVYLETTNRCNLLCTTCPRTYAELEPPADMSWGLFTSIVDQIPNVQRAVLHGVGEPMLVQYQWRAPQREERPRADRGGPRRASRLARCIEREVLSGHPRQGLLWPHPQERACVPQSAGT